MSINDDFYSHFPSLNSNSKENQRNKRISREYTDYMRNLKKDSPKQSKSQQRIRRSRESVVQASPSEPQSPSMDIIFSAEDRNRAESQQKEQKRKIYQESLERQIEEQRMKKQKEIEKIKREELLLEKRLQKQIENIRLQKDPLADKVVERISLSENEKESYNTSKISSLSTSSSNNDVYRYFSHSAKIDSDLFNYKKYFSDVRLEALPADLSSHEFSIVNKPAKTNKVLEALKQAEGKNSPTTPEIDSCPGCATTHAECSRCHKKLEMYCKDCDEEHDKVSPETTNQLQIEYNEPEELPFSKDQQVVVYRPSEQHVPYSFNIEPNSQFYKNSLMDKDAMENMRLLSEMKMANYIRLYGDLRKRQLEDKVSGIPPKPTGAIPKQKPVKSPDKSYALMTSQSDLDAILGSAQRTVITQLGFAKQQLELEKLKL